MASIINILGIPLRTYTKEEAERFYKELKERLAKFNLKLSEDKSKIIKFGKKSGNSKDIFNFLGFTHINS